MKWNSYYRLSRLHQPIGIILLWCPTAWALWLATPNQSWYLVFLFFLGTVFMRSAGCIVNDIADRQIDLHVKRTEKRPLTTGEVTLIEAISLLGIYLGASLVILLQLPSSCFLYALSALFITIIYPFTKR